VRRNNFAHGGHDQGEQVNWYVFSITLSSVSLAFGVALLFALLWQRKRADKALLDLDDAREALATLNHLVKRYEAGDMAGAMAVLGITVETHGELPFEEIDGIFAVRVHDLMVRAGIARKGENT